MVSAVPYRGQLETGNFESRLKGISGVPNSYKPGQQRQQKLIYLTNQKKKKWKTKKVFFFSNWINNLFLVKKIVNQQFWQRAWGGGVKGNKNLFLLKENLEILIMLNACMEKSTLIPFTIKCYHSWPDLAVHPNVP